MKFRVGLWIALALIAINLIVYSQVRHYEFIGWDDPLYVSQNARVSQGLTWSGIAWAFTTWHAANWHPITWLSHMLDVQVFGVAAGPHHLVNLFLHIVNTLLLFLVLFRMTGAWGQSAFVAGLFAVHPQHVESVAWIAERKDVLSTLFLLLTLLAYTDYVGRPLRRRYLLVMGFFALALMSKPMVVTLPFLLLLLDVWPLRRIKLERGQKRVWLQLIQEKLPLVALSIASSVVTIAAQWNFGSVQTMEMYPLSFRLANIPISYVAYVGSMLWPRNLCIFYPLPDHYPATLWIIGCVLFLAAATSMAIWAARRHPYCLIGWLWYLISLVPVIGLIQVGNQARADRYTYVPLIGLFMIAAWAIPNLAGRWPYRNIALAAGAGALICVLAAAAKVQAGCWSDSLTLWEHAVESTTDNHYAYVNAGLALESRGEHARAIDYYTKAIQINPGYAEAHNGIALALIGHGEIDQAIEHLRRALRIQPSFGEAHSNLGCALIELGKTEEGIDHLEAALGIDPDNAVWRHNMGLALAKLGKTDEALAQFAEVLRRSPDYVEAYNQRADIFVHNGKLEEAVAEYNKALSVKPDWAEAHNNLANALMSQKKEDEAITHYEEALRLNPDLVEAHYNLAVIFMGRRSYDKAILHLTELVRRRPNDLGSRNMLGIAVRRRDAQARDSHN